MSVLDGDWDTTETPPLWRLREDHERFNRGEIVAGIPDSQLIRTDTIIRCGRTTRGKAQIINVPLYKLERYEMPKPAAAPKWWTAIKAEQKAGVEPGTGYTDWKYAHRWAGRSASEVAIEEAELHRRSKDWINQRYESDAFFWGGR